jgi:hypothetical protein
VGPHAAPGGSGAPSVGFGCVEVEIGEVRTASSPAQYQCRYLHFCDNLRFASCRTWQVAMLLASYHQLVRRQCGDLQGSFWPLQGSTRAQERVSREKERQQLADLVGRNLTYVSQLDGLDFARLHPFHPLFKLYSLTHYTRHTTSPTPAMLDGLDFNRHHCGHRPTFTQHCNYEHVT